ncbi:zinc finger protein JAGGED-like [Senna tora]|uniref:Zinc finger protein JAGGED-like n=1 Tax=Senna tora TaxID=362788 RepID=A0A834TTH6_9FABA|nr:zinc finger protein JAGGED-like [Senna tora]
MSPSVGTIPCRRPEEIPLDLNNLPDDYSRDGKQVALHHEDSSSSGCSRKKKSGGKEGKEECGKFSIYSFSSLGFNGPGPGRAVGFAERETETLNHARQLVFRSDHTIAAQGPPHHLGCCQGIGGGGYHGGGEATTMGVRFPRYPAGPAAPPQAPAYNLYGSPTGGGGVNQNEYYVGHVMHNYGGVGVGVGESSYTCVGAPVGLGGKEGSVVQRQEEVMNWGRSYSGINRFQDGF